MLDELIASLRGRHAALATTLVRGTQIEVEVDPGSDPVDAMTLFEVGSITKTITGTLLAVLVIEGTLRLDSRVGDLLDDAGGCANVTLLELATHTSGLPRLAPNHASVQTEADDPYAAFGVEALHEAINAVEPAPAAEPDYSNFGFQLLGHLLSVARGRPFGVIAVEEVLIPAGCTMARCGTTEPDDRRIPVYAGSRTTPRWSQPLPGAGGVELNIVDFGRWILANVEPDATPLSDAVRLAQEAHWGDRRTGRGLGWRHYNGGLIHNGGTGGSHAFAGLVPGRAGVGVLTNLGGWDAIDAAAIGFLTRVVTAPAAERSEPPAHQPG